MKQTIVCPHCRFRNAASAQFCGNCGRPLTNAASPKRDKSLLFAILILIGGLIILAAAGLYYVSARNNAMVAAATQSEETNSGSKLFSAYQSPPATLSPIAAFLPAGGY